MFNVTLELNKYISPPNKMLSMYVYSILVKKYLMFLYLKAIVIISIMVISSNNNLFILVNNIREDNPPNKDDISIRL